MTTGGDRVPSIPGVGAVSDGQKFPLQPGLGVPQYASKLGTLSADDKATAEVQESRHDRAFHDDVAERRDSPTG